MGYNHTFIIAEPSFDDFSKCGKFWANIVAVFRLRYDRGLYDITRNYPETRYFVYGENEREVTEDPYGDPLTEVPLVDLIGDLESIDALRTESHTAALLAALNVYKNDPRKLIALHYGE